MPGRASATPRLLGQRHVLQAYGKEICGSIPSCRPLERPIRKEGYENTPHKLNSEFFDTLDSFGRPGFATTIESVRLKP